MKQKGQQQLLVPCLEGKWLPSGVAGVKHGAIGELPRVVTPANQVSFTDKQ